MRGFECASAFHIAAALCESAPHKSNRQRMSMIPATVLSACELTHSNSGGLDRLGALERRAGKAAVHIGAQRGP
jgi:hypothetical protein